MHETAKHDKKNIFNERTRKHNNNSKIRTELKFMNKNYLLSNKWCDGVLVYKNIIVE